MAQVAYDLERFAPPAHKTAPRIRVAKSVRKERGARSVQMFKMLRILMGVMVLVGLVCALLFTQAAVTEVTTQIADLKDELREEESLNTYLSFTLDNKTSLRSIEESAANMGLSKIDSGQIHYFRVEDISSIRVKENFFTSALNKTKNGLLSIVDYWSA